MSRQVDLEGEVHYETARAVEVKLATGETIWIPRSVLLDGDALTIGDTDLVCAEWFALKEGLA